LRLQAAKIPPLKDETRRAKSPISEKRLPRKRSKKLQGMIDKLHSDVIYVSGRRTNTFDLNKGNVFSQLIFTWTVVQGRKRINKLWVWRAFGLKFFVGRKRARDKEGMLFITGP